ncbi:efflux RND transporter periplasmic adaptor subunit [Caulifigura coniformis]|uniref:efflux RND transporter periplasmic adaptor subunit n=1 Tax=Caulifigura coniformis TaxID=2527983 RepID=UPI001E42A816|nr:efflux RND transporter periplasmic adaptor subunit [Caulifigura coniformis]
MQIIDTRFPTTCLQSRSLNLAHCGQSIRYRRLLVLVALLGASASTGGCAKQVPAAAKKSEPPKVTVATPVKMPIVEWDEYVGRLEALETVEVRSRISGYLASTHFDEGQLVKEGDLLAVIDQRPILAEIARNDADLSSAEAQLGQANASLSQAQAEFKRSEIRLDLAQKRLTRTNQLRQRNATTSDEFDLREAEFAEAQSEQAVAQARIDSSKSVVVAAEAAVGIAKANLSIAKLNLQYTEIKAPISGRISRRYVTEGNLVSGGSADSTLLTTIVSVDPIHCYFDADEQAFLKYMRLASEGIRPSSRDVRNPVYLALANERDGFPHWGHMDFVDNRLDEETSTIRGRAILSNKDMKLTPGLFARVRLPGSSRYDAVLIPDRAIGTDQAEKFVLTVGDDNKIVRKVVRLGPISHGLRIIREGLIGDERVVLGGMQRAKPGIEVAATVEVLEATKESLPDTYEPVPEGQWLTPKRKVAANASAPIGSPPTAKPAIVTGAAK